MRLTKILGGLFLLQLMGMLLPSCATAAGRGYAYIVVTDAQGTARSFAMQRTVLTFKDGEMRLAGKDVNETFPLATLAKVSFSDEAVGIRLAQEGRQTLSLRDGDRLMIESDRPLTAKIYDSEGKEVLSAAVQAGRREINIASLPGGVYVIKAGRGSLKITKP